MKNPSSICSYTVDSVKSFCPHWSFLNHILIIGKQVLYSSRLSKSKPLLSQFVVKLKQIERIEHYIAKNGDRFSFHEKKRENHKKMIFKLNKLSYKSYTLFTLQWYA